MQRGKYKKKQVQFASWRTEPINLVGREEEGFWALPLVYLRKEVFYEERSALSPSPCGLSCAVTASQTETVFTIA